jgi:NMD protein affecting ribosome stability and mRNA decay
MKIVKIDVCNYEDNLFDDKSIIVNCILDLDNDSEYKIRVMIDNDCIDYSFIDINITHKMCELLSIAFLKLNKSREVKSYDEKRNKNIIHVIYSSMIIQNHIENSIFMIIIKLNQHLIILEKS